MNHTVFVLKTSFNVAVVCLLKIRQHLRLYRGQIFRKEVQRFEFWYGSSVIK